MIERYSRPDMASVWSDATKFSLWLEVEIAVCRAWARRGRIPSDSLAVIESKARYDTNRMAEIEAEVGHDVIAFLTSVAENVGPDSRYIHMGMTSSDLIDTAFAVQLVRAGRLIEKDMDSLLDVIKKRAFEHKHTPMMGRSHGVHAEPITLGLKLAVWYEEFSRHAKRLKGATQGVGVGKISGAVGTYAHIDPEIEIEVCGALGLVPAPVSTQIIQRDRHAHFFSVLAGVASSVEKVAVEIRNLQRTEIGEVAEPFGKKQKGSSAMPHKRNPILCENLTGLARVVRANSMAALEDVALWHERDISHSSVERVIAPDSTTLVDFMLARLTRVLEGLEVYPKKMIENLNATMGVCYSQGVMLALVEKGMTREEAYRLVQSAAVRALHHSVQGRASTGHRPLFDELANDKRVLSKLGEEELKKLFNLDIHLRHVDRIFERVFP